MTKYRITLDSFGKNSKKKHVLEKAGNNLLDLK